MYIFLKAEQTRVNGGKTNECKTRIPRPQEIVSVIEEELQGEEVSVILEPGRSLVGNAGILATEVLGVKPAKPNRYKQRFFKAFLSVL